MNVTTHVFSRAEVDAIQNAIGIQLAEKDKELLQAGLYSSLIEELPEPGTSSKKAGKIHLNRDPKTKEVAVCYHYAKEALFIPETIAGHKLTGEEKQSLKNGDVVQIKNKRNQNLYLQIDKELNSITVKGDRELNIPNVIGANLNYGYKGYELSDADKHILANKGRLEPKVLCGDYGFFLASFEMTADRKGYTFENYQTIPMGKVTEYLEKYNTNPVKMLPEHKELKKEGQEEIIEKVANTSNVVENEIEKNNLKEEKIKLVVYKDHTLGYILPELPNSVQILHSSPLKGASGTTNLQGDYPINNPNEIRLASEKDFEAFGVSFEGYNNDKEYEFKQERTENKVVHRDLDKEFMEALNNHDFKKMNDLADGGYKLADKHIQHIDTMPNLSDNDKVAIKTLFKVEPKEEIKDIKPKVKIEESKAKIEEKAKEQEKPNKRTGEKVGNIVNQMFRE